MANLFPPSEGGLAKFVEIVNSSLKALSVQGQASHMLQVTQDISESLLNSKSSCDIDPSVSPLPIVCHPSITPISAEEAAEYKMERHREVINP